MYETIARSCAERGETIFWRNYKRLCEDFGSNPTAVARELGISSGTVTGWKSGRMPRIYALQRIDERFSVAVQDLVSGAPTKPKTPSPKDEMRDRIYEAAEAVTDIIRHYSESSEYLAEYANVVVQAATSLAELAKVATK